MDYDGVASKTLTDAKVDVDKGIVLDAHQFEEFQHQALSMVAAMAFAGDALLVVKLPASNAEVAMFPSLFVQVDHTSYLMD